MQVLYQRLGKNRSGTKKRSLLAAFVPKERFELSRALCPLRPERSASAYSATSAYNIILPKPKGLSIIFRRVVLPEDNPLLSQNKIL